MKLALPSLTILLLLTSSLRAYQVGDYLPDKCWKDQNSNQVCLDDYLGKVRVLDFSAGWCGPCNTKMKQISQQADKLDPSEAMFMSNSVQGWSSGSPADERFLREWQSKHSIPDSVPVVAVSRMDFIQIAGGGGYPTLVIVDQNSKIVYRKGGASLSDIFQRVNKLVKEGPSKPPYLIGELMRLLPSL